MTVSSRITSYNVCYTKLLRIRDFHRAGVDRDEATRGKIRALREELVSLGQEFTRNIVTGTREILLDAVEELKGLPEDYIKAHPPSVN